MTAPHDDRDDEERALLEGLDDQLHALRARHVDDPSLGVLAAASAEALPPPLQARVQAHLASSPWSRTLLEGSTLSDDVLDGVGEARILARVRRDVQSSPVQPRRWGLMTMVGGALAASLIAAALWPRQTSELPSVAPARPVTSAHPSPPTPAGAPAPLPLDKPDVRLQLAALTWRGAPDANPYLQDLSPAVTAYRADDYRTAAAAFDTVAGRYPGGFEAWFYGGIAHLFLGAHERAVKALAAAAPLADPDMADETQWYLAVAEQRAGRQDAAAARLRDLCAAGGDWGARACVATAAWEDGPSSSRQPEPE